MAPQPQPLHPAPGPPSTVLVVGNLLRWQRAGRLVPNLPGFHFSAFGAVTANLLHDLDPALVLSALMGDDYDVIELARKLAWFGFDGQYRALTAGLPDAALVLNEVRAVAPGLDFALLDVASGVLAWRG